MPCYRDTYLSASVAVKGTKRPPTPPAAYARDSSSAVELVRARMSGMHANFMLAFKPYSTRCTVSIEQYQQLES